MPETPGQPTSPPGARVVSRILVVDDDHDSAETLAELMRIWKYEVRVSHDGPSALAAARTFRPHVVLLDIGLPGQDGYDVARLLRQEGLASEACLIALTGYGQDEDRKKALAAGFDRHLVKPVTPELLKQVLSQGA